MYTLAEMTNQVKRKVGQLAPSSATSSSEQEKGFMFSDQAIYDAINIARTVVPGLLVDAGAWIKIMKTIPTTTDEQDYGLDTGFQRLLNVVWDVGSTGAKTTDSYEATKLDDEGDEAAVFDDPFQTPSVTNPYCRIINRAVRIIVSTDGTVETGKYILVEYNGDLEQLTTASQNSGVTDQIDVLCVEHATATLTARNAPSIAAKAIETLNTLVAKLNQDRRLSQ
jgi:hypothetical protein